MNLKTQAPEIPPFAIHRHDLIQTLQSNARKRFIFFVAAGGWGKSTLLASYARTLTCPCLWYNVEPNDQDPAVFLSLFASGLYQIIPQKKKGLLPLLTAFKQGGSDPMSLFRHLFNTSLNDPSQKLVLIFDDYHLAGTNPRFDSAFRSLVEKAPLNLHIVIASREEPRLLRSECSYAGDFLPEDLYQQWTLPIPEQTRSMYLRALYATAEAYHHKLEFERCILQIQYLLREEPWDEKACLLMMKCYFALGDRPRLIKAFQTCSSVLKEELDITPGEPLRRFYDQAIGN